MKTYCWKCEKQTRMNNPGENERNRNLITGLCESCGLIVYKTLRKPLQVNRKI